MRYFAIGDIHGSLDLLENLLKEVDKEAAKQDSVIVFLGDYVDRGPDSFGVIDLLRKRNRENNVFLCGNHDEELRRACRMYSSDQYIEYDYYASVNDEDFIDSYRKNGYKILNGEIHPKHKEFFAFLYSYYDTENAFFVHAGVDPFKNLTDGSMADYLWIRAPFLNWHGPFAKTIVHGHSITKSGKVEFDGRKISVDTGVCKNGRLSCAIIQDGILVDTITSEKRNKILNISKTY